MTNSRVLFGQSAAHGRYRPTQEEELLFKGTGNSAFALSERALFQHLLLIGGTGSGKTNVLCQILPQLRDGKENDHVTLVFDTKADYFDHRWCSRSGDYVLGSSRSFRDISEKWNVFHEILADGDNPIDYEANAREIAAILFKDRVSQMQPFFGNAARDIFAHALIYMVRRSKEDPAQWRGRLNNYDLFQFLMGQQVDTYRRCFESYNDMRGLVTYFGDGSTAQALGVFGELRSVISDCFQDVFQARSDEHTGFSIRRAIRNKGRKAIFIEYDLSLGESVTPIYRLLVDLALKEALSGNANGRTYLLLDELKLLPRVTHLQDALNFGRSKKVSVIAGIQNVNQIYAIYGKETGECILGGFGSVFAFHMPDADSRRYIREALGTNVQGYRYMNQANQPIDRERDGYTVEDWELRQLEVGQAVIRLASQNEPFVFRFLPDPYA